MSGSGREYRDALPNALPAGNPGRRHAAGLNPGNRFETNRFWLDGDFADELAGELAEHDDRPGRVSLEVIADTTRTIINKVDPTSDVPFSRTVSPYRGCAHSCIYCYARPYHEFLGYSCGLDFETKLIVKHDAPSLLKRELADPRWQPVPIVMSAITDVYQPLEAKLGLTRQCLQIMAEAGQPVATMTKGSLVLRDLDLWSELASKNAGHVTVTIVTLDPKLAATLEPQAASPAVRLKMIRKLASAGVPVNVNVSPIIPGLTDVETPRILEAVADAGATSARWVLLRLPYQLKELFVDWMQRNLHPDRAARVESLLRQSHFGKLYDARSTDTHTRGRGTGPIAGQIRNTFNVFARRYGLDRPMPPLLGEHFKHPTIGQMRLFD